MEPPAEAPSGANVFAAAASVEASPVPLIGARAPSHDEAVDTSHTIEMARWKCASSGVIGSSMVGAPERAKHNRGRCTALPNLG